MPFQVNANQLAAIAFEVGTLRGAEEAVVLMEERDDEILVSVRVRVPYGSWSFYCNRSGACRGAGLGETVASAK